LLVERSPVQTKLIPLLIALLLLISGCGPGDPEGGSQLFLQKQGYDQAVIDALLNGEDLGADRFVDLVRFQNPDVNFLVGQNPYTPPTLLDDLLAGAAWTRSPLNRLLDNNEWVRAGVARNVNLAPAQMATIFADPSHTVLIGLAENPGVPHDLLRRLHTERGIDLLWFAGNPNCPDDLLAAIQTEGDDQARYWLDFTLGDRATVPGVLVTVQNMGTTTMQRTVLVTAEERYPLGQISPSAEKTQRIRLLEPSTISVHYDDGLQAAEVSLGLELTRASTGTVTVALADGVVQGATQTGQ
jgi:hypothetical protein